MLINTRAKKYGQDAVGFASLCHNGWKELHMMQNKHILEPLKVYGAILETTHLFYQGKHPTCKPTVQLFSRPFCGTIVQTELQFERRILKKYIYMCEKLRQ